MHLLQLSVRYETPGTETFSCFTAGTAASSAYVSVLTEIRHNVAVHVADDGFDGGHHHRIIGRERTIDASTKGESPRRCTIPVERRPTIRL